MTNPSTRIDDTRLEAIVLGIIEDVEARKARSIVIARGAENIRSLIAEATTRPAEHIRRENEIALKAMADFAGNPRDAARFVARKMSDDPHEQEIWAQRLRRLRRGQK